MLSYSPPAMFLSETVNYISLFFTHLYFRYTFPDEFEFGCATSSYQVEGAWDVDGTYKLIDKSH